MNEFHPDRIFATLEEAADDVEKKLYRFRRLDKLEKVLLAELALKEDGGVSLREMKARASQEYKDHVEGLAVAESEYNRARAKYNDLNTLAELRRTEETSRRSLTRG